MDEKTLEALKGSIRKWEKVVDGTGSELGMDNCPLCQVFVKGQQPGKACEGCPVMLETGRAFCVDTPYTDYADAEDAENVAGMNEAAIEELEFLKSLLPRQHVAHRKSDPTE